MAMTKWVPLTMLAVAVSVVVTGCGFRPIKGPISGKTWMQMHLDAEYFAEVREDYVRRHPALSPEHAAAIRAGTVRLGMSEASVKAALNLYTQENPHGNSFYGINTSVGAWGTHRTLTIYGPRYSIALMLFFQNDVLTSLSN